MTSCGWILFDEDVCLVCDRPTILCFDDRQQLHAEGKPAIAFADSTGMYVHHGVQFSDRYGKLAPQQWQSEWLLTRPLA